MRTLTLVVALALVALAAAPALAAHTESKRYVGGLDLYRLEIGPANFGGASFKPLTGETTVTVSVQDEVAGNAVLLLVCQDVGGDDKCGNGADAVASGCAPVTLALGSDTAPVGVWVSSAFSTVVGCSAPATRGVLTATFG